MYGKILMKFWWNFNDIWILYLFRNKF